MFFCEKYFKGDGSTEDFTKRIFFYPYFYPLIN